MLWMARKWKLDGQPGTVLQKLWIEILIARKCVRPYAGKSFHIHIEKNLDSKKLVAGWQAENLSKLIGSDLAALIDLKILHRLASLGSKSVFLQI